MRIMKECAQGICLWKVLAKSSFYKMLIVSSGYNGYMMRNWSIGLTYQL